MATAVATKTFDISLLLALGFNILIIIPQQVSCYSQLPCFDACGLGFSSGCLELVNNDLNENLVAGCYGTYSNGVISDSALNICNRDNGWHLCESANEAAVLGLTTDICSNTVPSGHSFWTLESSLDGDGNCFSNNGYVSWGDRPFNDVWGCVSSDTSISGCGDYENTQCGPLNMGCSETGPNNGDYGDSGVSFCGYESGCGAYELFVMKTTDPSKNGVLCCSDKIPSINPYSQCDESITVWSLRAGYSQPLPNFAPHIGKYVYYGNNENGYPRYVHTQSGAEITVSNFMTADLVLKLIIPDYGIFWSPATSFETGYVINAGNNRFEINEDYFSPWGTDTSMSLTNSDHLEWIANGAATLQMTATFNDCQYYGLEKVSYSTSSPVSDPTPKPSNYPTQPTPSPTDPTVKPTNNPVTPTPKPSNNPTAPTPVPSENNNNNCPNYDYTTYASCSEDTHCTSCQSWGCAQCETGYYKMGNQMRCQSCSGIYSNCQQCGDWNGCTTCNQGYTLTWDPLCNDETCQ